VLHVQEMIDLRPVPVFLVTLISLKGEVVSVLD
jgi:hypothetical protein